MSIDVPNYRILEQLGTGQGGSTLWKAMAVKSARLYTIKHIKVQRPEDMGLVEQMKDEHACGSAMDHPALRKTYELRQIRRRLSVKAALLFMEYVEGVSLADCGPKFSLSELLRVIEKAAVGLAAMHEGGYVHADIKPGNILVLPSREIKLIDFGQSCQMNQAKKRVQGSIDYMAPEQAAKQKLTARTDVFCLGATLHRVLTGKPVATEMNQTVAMHSLGRVGMRLEDNLPPSLDGLPPVITKLINDCCAKRPDQRPRDMHEFIVRCGMARTILAKRQETAEATEGERYDI